MACGRRCAAYRFDRSLAAAARATHIHLLLPPVFISLRAVATCQFIYARQTYDIPERSSWTQVGRHADAFHTYTLPHALPFL